jgi:hypothetical protein
MITTRVIHHYHKVCGYQSKGSSDASEGSTISKELVADAEGYP